MKVLDSTLLIDLLRGDKGAEELVKQNDFLLTTQINMFEVIRGLFYRNASAQKIAHAMEMFENIRVVPLDDNGIIKSADISSTLIRQGKTIEDSDCLIAGIALSKGITTIVTRNVKDFEKIKGLEVETY